MTCSVCQHSQRPAIDQALVTGTVTLAALAKQYNLSTSALHRHKAHLQARVSRAQDQFRDNLRQGCLFWLSQALEMTMQIARTAQAEGNARLVLQAVSQGIRLINIILKQELPLDNRVIYEILSSPQWAAQTSLLPDDPELMSLSRQFLAGSLNDPCPDTPAQPSNHESATDLDMSTLYALFPELAQPCADQPETGHPQPSLKSGKLPGKTLPRKDNNVKNQEDKLWEKIAGMTGRPFLAGPVPPSPGNSKLETLLQQCATSGLIPADKPLSEYLYEQSLQNKGVKNQPAQGQLRQL